MTNAGIETYGAYIPITRLPLSVISGKAPKEGDAEKAVAWSDEDAVTMAVAAGQNCLRGTGSNKIDASKVDVVMLATTTLVALLAWLPRLTLPAAAGVPLVGGVLAVLG